MTTPRFPAVDRDGKIQDAHLPSRLSESELVSLIQRESSGGGTSKPTAESGLEMLAMKLAFGGAGQHTVAVVADSTMNDSNDPLRIFDRMYSAELSDTVRHVYHNWYTAENGWRHTINSEGDITPAHDGVIVEDNFNRVEAELYGSTPDVGAPWAGRTGAWSSDGSVARSSGGSGALTVDTNTKNMRIDARLHITAESDVAQSIRFCLGSTTQIAQNGYMVSLNLTNAGGFLIYPYTVFEGTSTRIGDQITGTGLGLLPGSSGIVDLIIEIDIQNVKVTATGPNGIPVESVGLLTEGQYGSLGTWAGLHSISDVASGFAVDSMKITTAPQPPVGDTLDVWNGAIAGGRWSTFNDTKLDQMFGGLHVDVLMLSMGHNNGSQSGPDFVAETEAWIDLWMSHHPETQAIVWISQNPQFPPATGVSTHRGRQLAMRVAAKQKWEYVAGYEAFSSRPDGGQSMVGADGIHPTTPGGGSMDGDYGAVLMAETILGAVHARI